MAHHTALLSFSVLAVLTNGSVAIAQTCSASSTVVATDTFGPMLPPWSGLPLSVPQFDASLGQLVSATVEVKATLQGLVLVENLSFSPAELVFTLASQVNLQYPPGISQALSTVVDISGYSTLAPFDGVVDYQPPSGGSYVGLMATSQQVQVFTNSTVLASEFSGSASLVLLHSATAFNSFAFTGRGAVFSDTLTSLDLRVTYKYCPSGTTSSHCAGDGSLSTVCPCGNFGFADRGCENSALSGGALLSLTGTVSPDTLVLAQHGQPVGSFSVFLQGSAFLASGTFFGDGVRCVGGSQLVLYAKRAAGTSVVAPAVGDPSITARSAALGDPIPPGSPRFYQVSYRDIDPTFCSMATFNIGNAVRVVW